MPPLRWALPCIAALLFVAGCNRHPQSVTAAPPKPAPKPEVNEIDLKSSRPNEAGSIMIVMYHRFNAKEKPSDLNRTPDEFRKDLEDLYSRGYRPVNVTELAENKMDVAAGKTPVALTFDDALPSQFKTMTGTDGQTHIDPDCAVGIMESFHKQHPDWPLKGTFFVLPKEGPRGTFPFGQPDSVPDKFEYLIGHGYEIANHSSTHPTNFWRLSADKIKWELATAQKDIKAINPKAQMTAMAIPYGRLPRDPGARKGLVEGESDGTAYKHVAVLRAAWRPVLSPVTKKAKTLENQPNFCVFDPYALERCTADSRHPNVAGTFEYWLKFFDENKSQRYVSDGNPLVVAVPKAQASIVDPARVKKYGQILQAYAFGGGATGTTGGGSGLSVQ